MSPTMKGRRRRRLEAAREKGYLDAACPDAQELARWHGRWCWRLRLPLVWLERHSPRSRYGRLHLEMFTAAHLLTAEGQAAMRSLWRGAGVTAHDASWSRIPLPELDRMAHRVLR